MNPQTALNILQSVAQRATLSQMEIPGVQQAFEVLNALVNPPAQPPSDSKAEPDKKK